MPYSNAHTRAFVLITLICSIIHIVDRSHSLSILLPKKTGAVDGMMYMSADYSMESVDNTVIFDAMVEVIKKSERDQVVWGIPRGT